MSAYGSAAYGSLPVDATTSVSLDGTSALALNTEGQFVTVSGPLTIFTLRDFEGRALTAEQRRGLYSGEVFVYEEHFFWDVDLPGQRIVKPTTYVSLATADTSIFTLGTNPSTGAEVVDRIYNVSGSSGMTLGTQPAIIDAFTAQASQPTAYSSEGTPQTAPHAFRAEADSRFVQAPESTNPFTASADSRFEQSPESGIGTPLVVNDPGDQSGNEGQSFLPPPSAPTGATGQKDYDAQFGGTTLNLSHTAPAAVQEGDLMVVTLVGMTLGGTPPTANLDAAWTLVKQTSGTTQDHVTTVIATKIADASDVTESTTYVHNFTGGETFKYGSVMCARIPKANGDELRGISTDHAYAAGDPAVSTVSATPPAGNGEWILAIHTMKTGAGGGVGTNSYAFDTAGGTELASFGPAGKGFINQHGSSSEVRGAHRLSAFPPDTTSISATTSLDNVSANGAAHTSFLHLFRVGRSS